MIIYQSKCGPNMGFVGVNPSTKAVLNSPCPKRGEKNTVFPLKLSFLPPNGSVNKGRLLFQISRGQSIEKGSAFLKLKATTFLINIIRQNEEVALIFESENADLFDYKILNKVGTTFYQSHIRSNLKSLIGVESESTQCCRRTPKCC